METNTLTLLLQLLAAQKAAIVPIEAVHSPAVSPWVQVALQALAVIAALGVIVKQWLDGQTLKSVKIAAEKAEALGNSTLGESKRTTAAATAITAAVAPTEANIKIADSAQKSVEEHDKAQRRANDIQAVADGIQTANGKSHQV